MLLNSLRGVVMTDRGADRAKGDSAGAPRDAGVEAGRYAMALLVIVLHVLYAPVANGPFVAAPLWVGIVDCVTRAAVPFFFVASGFYLRTDRPLGQLVLRPIVRILPIFVFWVLLYWVVAHFAPHMHPTRLWLGLFLSGGAAYHLWFLPALLFAQIAVALGERLLGSVVTGVIVVLLALAGPILWDYGPIFGLGHAVEPLLYVARQMAAPAFVWLGVRARTQPRVAPLVAWPLAGAAGVSLWLEDYAVSRLSGHPGYVSYDILFSTFAFGYAAFVAARSVDHTRWARRLAPLGRLSLGIYAVHLLFVIQFREWLGNRAFWPAMLAVLLSAVCSTLVAAVLVRIPGLQRLTS